MPSEPDNPQPLLDPQPPTVGDARLGEIRRPEVLVVNTGSVYSQAIVDLCDSRGVTCHLANELRNVEQDFPRLAGCVIEESRPAARERLAQLRELRRIYPYVPIVVLVPDPGCADVARLESLGISCVIPMSTPPRAVADHVLNLFEQQPGPLSELIGDSPAMRRLRHEIASYAKVDSSILLTGETGTGKGLVARLVHEVSGVPGPFVHADCTALTPTLIESELFGHERGAFTGAVSRRVGRFEQARGGTIFLDEVTEVDLHLQAKLLRVLEDSEYERIGGGQTHRLEARVIAATNREPRVAVADNALRADLYFRLNVIRINIPPLRQRLVDIPQLAGHWLERLCKKLDRPHVEVASSFLARLAAYSWPGNVRELRNVLEQALVRHPGDSLEDGDLDGILPEDDAGAPMMPPMRPQALFDAPESPECAIPEHHRAERQTIAHTLTVTGGNVTRSARRLSMARRTLRGKIERYGLQHLTAKD